MSTGSETIPENRDGSKAAAHFEYEVTRTGEVYSLTSNWRGYGKRLLRQTLNEDGYPSVRITVNGKRRRYAVHKLVAERFLEAKPSPRHEVRHLDGNKLNPSADNLAWGTQKQNADDRERHGRTSRGPKHAEAIRIGQRGYRLALAASQRSGQ